MSESIQCNGNELESVLAGIRERDGFVASLETRVGKLNAQYRVNYFDGIVTEDCGLSRKDAVEVDGVKDTICKNPVSESPTDPNPFPHQCETPANPAAPEAVKGAVAPRDPFKMTTKSLVIGQPVGQKPSGAETVGVDFSNRPGCTETAPLVSRDDLSIETPLPHCPTCSSHVTQGLPCPICAGLERIRDGARRLRNRFRPSTREARIPHND